MHVKWFALASSLAILLFVVELIRKQKMTFKYSMVWLAISAVVFLSALYPDYLFRLSEWVGFSLPSNFIFFLLVLFVVFLSLLLTIYANDQNSRSELLAQSIAKLEYRIQQIEKKK